MGARFDKIMTNEQALSKRIPFNKGEFLIVIMIGLFALFARLSLFSHESGDFNTFLMHWYQDLKDAGGFAGIGQPIGNYTPAYLYILASLTYLPFDSLTAIKLTSCLFDFFIAIFAMMIIWNMTRKTTYTIMGYALILFAPTVLLNGSFWAQCDVIYATFIVMSLMYFLKDRPFAATVCFSISLCFKLQAVFLLPFLIFMWCKDKMKLRHFLMIPVIFLTSLLPAFFAGRPMMDLLKIYISQSTQYKSINYNAPNIFTLIGGGNANLLSTAAVITCGVMVLLTLYILWYKKFEINKNAMLTIALFFAVLMPFLLPHMHERYFFVADILSIIFALVNIKKFYVALLVNFASFIAYVPFAFQTTKVPLYIGTACMFAAILILAIELYNQLKKPEIIKNEDVGIIDSTDELKEDLIKDQLISELLSDIR